MMSIENVLASIAVKDVKAAAEWYARLLGSAGTSPMPEVLEWRFPRGGCLQVYQLPERAGQGSCTLAVNDLTAEIRKLEQIGVDTSARTSNERVSTVMITDPDGNHIALARAVDPALAR
jgi:predicted enzyme related to lactoylglutathione lyase